MATITEMNLRIGTRRGWLAGLLVVSILLNALWVALNVGLPRDYGSFIASGQAASRGDNPYGVYEGTYHTSYDRWDLDLPNLNPPVSVYPFQALAQLDLGPGKALLNAGSIAAYTAVLFALARRYPDQRTPLILLWAISLAGFWHILELGQIYLYLLAAAAGAWLLQGRNPLLAGLLIGVVVALKPNFVAWPLLLLLGSDRRTGATALASAAALSAIPLTIDGTTIYRQWLEASRGFGGLEMPGNSALIALFARVGLDGVGLAASVALAGGLAVWALRSGATKTEVSAAGITAALLLGPVTWSGYSLFLLPILFSRAWGRWELAAAALLAFPVWAVLLIMPANAVTYVLAGGVYGWALLIMLGVVVTDPYRRRAAAQNEERPIAEPLPAAA